MMKKEISLSEKIALEAQPAKSLFVALAEHGIVLEAGCNGQGRCGRCRVRYLEGVPLPAASERRFFSAQELREGMRLACLHPVSKKCLVEPAYLQPAKVQIVAESSLPEPMQFQPAEVPETEHPTAGPKPLRSAETPEAAGMPGAVQAGETPEGGWCIAIDLGTTTIAMQARSLADGRVLATWKGMNPQRQYGSDVISRMQAAVQGQGGALKSSVEKALAEGISRLLKTLPGSGPAGIYLAGNTVMEHLLAGLPVEQLSRHPFLPVTLEEQKLALKVPGTDENAAAAVLKQPGPAASNRPGTDGHSLQLTLLPGFSAFVGADLLAGVLACGMHRQERVSLLIDLGTNGELVMGNRDRLLCTATAAGPAFEGGPGSMAPGTDVIAAIAELMEAGIVDETGLLAEPWFESGISWTPGSSAGQCGNTDAKGTLCMTQEQIRAVQMAKAAVYAGICILADEYGIGLSDIAEVYLAGGFGYYLNVEKAAKIGLFPHELKDRVRAVGNTSLTGAYIYGRNGAQQEANRIRKICTAINLAQQPSFEEIYLGHLDLK